MNAVRFELREQTVEARLNGQGSMDGEIVNPGDLHGRVLPANEVDLCWDGNQICALAGPDLVMLDDAVFERGRQTSVLKATLYGNHFFLVRLKRGLAS